jgi:hypothetical protein
MAAVRNSPKDRGVLEMIVRRPKVNLREVLETATLELAEGLAGDNWKSRGRPHPETQLTIANSRLISFLAGDRESWKWAGDQLFIDMDLSASNLPPGTRLKIGSATIEVSSQPHHGCSKFAGRYGADALEFVNSPEGRQLRLRGLYAQVLEAGSIRVGDIATKVWKSGMPQ